jgi:hypothetical protein
MEKTRTATAPVRCVLPATRDASAGSPWRARGQTGSSQTRAGVAVLPTSPAEFRAGQLAPQGSCRCGAWVNVSMQLRLIGELRKTPAARQYQVCPSKK